MIGLKVKKYLDENGIKYSYLSEKAGIPMNMLSPTLNGKRKMSAEACQQRHLLRQIIKVSKQKY